MDLRSLVAEHRSLQPFALAAARLRDDAVPISRFVAELRSRPNWSTAEVRAFFGQSGAQRPGGQSYRELGLLLPEYEEFLDEHRFHPVRDRIADPAEVVHDVIGHVTLGHPVTPFGELCACAGVAGFSHAVGIDYFINALLMFSLGYRLFDDVPPARVAITPEAGAAIEAAHGAGATLAGFVGYSDRGKHETLAFVVGNREKVLQRAEGKRDGQRTPT